MQLTKKQEQGLKIAVERYKNGEKYTIISGYAGTGKSTLVKFIIEALDVDPKKVCYATYTGKAAEVLRKKGNKNAQTLHKLLYDYVAMPSGGFIKKAKEVLDYDVVVIDEISMASNSLIKLLAKHKCYVICLGDPFQLPTINPEEDNHLLEHPHIFLDEIMRQAADSEIIQLSLNIRQGKPIQKMSGKNVKVFNQYELNTGMLLWADQVLVGTNNAKIKYNMQIRQLLGRSNFPEEGDKIICNQNYWNTCSKEGNPLVNGTIGTLHNIKEKKIYLPYAARVSMDSMNILEADILSDDGKFHTKIDKKFLLENESTCDWETIYKLNDLKFKYGDLVPKEFSYGYALTYWKAQGSEWDKVLVIEQQFPFDRIEHQRAMYTAITRAADKLVFIKH